jgi:hypothetical protein
VCGFEVEITLTSDDDDDDDDNECDYDGVFVGIKVSRAGGG